MIEVKKSGRKLKYGEKTVLMRVPASMVPQVEAMMTKREVIAEIATYPPLVEAVIEAIAEVMNNQAEKVQAMIIEQLTIGIEFSPEAARPRLQAILDEYIESLPDSDGCEQQYVNVLRGVFDAAGNAAKPDLRLI